MEAQPELYVYYREEEMLPYAFCYLHELYPKRKGWDMNFMRDEQLSCPDFIIERVNGCVVTRVIVMVRMQKIISENHISEMQKYESIIKAEKHFKIEKILIVPAGCNTSQVPSDFKIIYLKEFHLQTT
ncbi:MAG: hypothetical protein V1904_12975 [Bacteroidota bacterium]